MAAAEFSELRDSGTRRLRVPCRECGSSIEIARLKEHLRASHHFDSTAVEATFLAALMDVRRSRRSRA